VIRIVIAAGLLWGLGGCAVIVPVLGGIAAVSEIAKTECGVSIGAFIQGQRPDCMPAPPLAAERWHP
jgi:hypothetical protein